jgi:hypothetical protein
MYKKATDLEGSFILKIETTPLLSENLKIMFMNITTYINKKDRIDTY